MASFEGLSTDGTTVRLNGTLLALKPVPLRLLISLVEHAERSEIAPREVLEGCWPRTPTRTAFDNAITRLRAYLLEHASVEIVGVRERGHVLRRARPILARGRVPKGKLVVAPDPSSRTRLLGHVRDRSVEVCATYRRARERLGKKKYAAVLAVTDTRHRKKALELVLEARAALTSMVVVADFDLIFALLASRRHRMAERGARASR